MLNQVNPIPTIAVKNLEAAKQFYEKKLGFVPAEPGDEYVQLYKCGNGSIEIYKSDFAGTNKAEFEHYEMPDTTLEGDIHVMKDMKMAWFKDLDGNILCMHNH